MIASDTADRDRREFTVMLTNLRLIGCPLYDLREGLAHGDPTACCEVLRRLASSSSEVLDQCSILGCDPGTTMDRKVVVTVMELLREFASEESGIISLSVNQFLKPALYLKKKYCLITSFSKYVKTQIDRFAPLLPQEEGKQPKKSKKKKTATLVDTLTEYFEREEEEAEEGVHDMPTANADVVNKHVTYEDEQAGNSIREEVPTETSQSPGVVQTIVTEKEMEGERERERQRQREREKEEEEEKEKKEEEEERKVRRVEEKYSMVEGQHAVMEKIEKHFHDSQSMMRMMLSLSKRIRSLEDVQPLDKEHSRSNDTTPERPSLASKPSGAQGKSVSNSPFMSKSNPIATLPVGPKYRQKRLSSLLVEETEQSQGGAGVTGGRNEEGGGNEDEDSLGTAYIDLLFSLMEKKMKASLFSSVKREINASIAASEQRYSAQLGLLATELDKIHGEFDRRLTKLEASVAMDKAEKNIEESELNKLIANSTFTPGNLSRFRVNAALSMER